VLDAAEPFFLGGGHDPAVDEETRPRVSVIGVDPEDVQGEITCRPRIVL
jgi:hypothetical protein